MLPKLLSLLCIISFVLGAPGLVPSVATPSTPGGNVGATVAGPYSLVTTSSNSSSTSATSSMTSSTSASTSGASTTTGVITIPLSSYSFTPYPTPTLNPRPPVFPATDPLNPPTVSSDPQVVPDFAPAWSIAYQKAKNLISEYTIEEKVNITTGVGWGNGLCVGNTPSIKTSLVYVLRIRPSPSVLPTTRLRSQLAFM
ncbi:hypothetical protein BDR05DRAFT_341767 [Suillus weaverae]|nr:hypothetical protein BDR05DRAFT_341767 [Suillus weaverae]